MDDAANEGWRKRRELKKTPNMKHCLFVLLAAAATFCFGGCADGIEPEREVKAAGYSPDPSGHIPRRIVTPEDKMSGNY
jgi:hypothetical protein